MAKKKTTKKKTVKKAPAKKKTTKKVTKKKVAKKVASTKKVTKKTATKKTATKKATKKKATKKKATKKKATKKKATKKKATKKKAVTKKVTKKVAKKKAVKKASSKKAAVKKAPTKKVTKKVTKKKALVRKPAPPPAPPAEPTEADLLQVDMDKEWTVAKLKRVKTGLSKKELSDYLQLLLEKRAEIIGNVQGMEDARNAALGDISHMPLHMADVGSDNFEQEFTLGLMESEREMLREIEEAILRMREGYYGVCLDSGRPIDPMRLEFAPWAKYCIEVARLREKRGW